MYQPQSFRESDESVAFDLIEEYGFATLVSWSTGEPMVSHVPLILDRAVSGESRLLGHLARANRHLRCFDGKQPAVAIFHGPHGYVSPSWYTTHPSVPTWNYAVVHVHGVPKTVDSDATWRILVRLVEKYEAPKKAAWKAELLPSDFVEKELRAIVGFEMPVSRIDAKFKLSQNKAEADRMSALEGLEHDGGDEGRSLAAFTRRYLEKKGERR